MRLEFVGTSTPRQTPEQQAHLVISLAGGAAELLDDQCLPGYQGGPPG